MTPTDKKQTDLGNMTSTVPSELKQFRLCDCKNKCKNLDCSIIKCKLKKQK